MRFETHRTLGLILVAAALSLPALPAVARPARGQTFKTRFSSGAACTVQLRRVRSQGKTKLVPHRILVERTDGARLLYNLSTDKVYLRTAKRARGGKTRTSMVKKDRVMYLLRGCSGSGKSTLAKTLAPGAKVMSTDDFFMKQGRYLFDVKKLGKAHGWNQKRAQKAARSGQTPLVIDNTFTRAWEARAYVESALENGYRIKLREPNTPWKFNAKELARRNSHGVSEAIIRKQISHYEHGINVADVLKTALPKASR
jgi:predicted kinase